MNPAARLQESCNKPAAILQESCSNPARNPAAIVQASCRSRAGVLWESWRTSAGIVLESCRNRLLCHRNVWVTFQIMIGRFSDFPRTCLGMFWGPVGAIWDRLGMIFRYISHTNSRYTARRLILDNPSLLFEIL